MVLRGADMGNEKTLGGPVETGGAKVKADGSTLLNPPLPPNSGDEAVEVGEVAMAEAEDDGLLSPPLPPNSGDGVGEPAETESNEEVEETAQGVEPPVGAGRGISMGAPAEVKPNEEVEEQTRGIEPAQEGERGIPQAPNANSATYPQKTAGPPHSTEPFYRRRRVFIVLAVSFMVFVLLTVGVVCYVMSSRGGQTGITSSAVEGSASGSVAGGRYTVSVDGAVASDDGSGVMVSVTWRNMGNVVDYMPDAVCVLQNGVALVRDKGYSDAHSLFMVLPGESVTVSYKYLTSDLKTDLEVQVGSKAFGLVGTTVKIRGE